MTGPKQPAKAKYIVYDTTDTSLGGSLRRILKTGVCPRSMFFGMAKKDNGEAVIEGTADDTLHCVDISNGIERIVNRPAHLIEAEEADRQARQRGKEANSLINARAKDILRRLAIAELKQEGKIKED